MAITTTITANPASLSFAGNPIVYHVKTSKALGTDESFLRITCRAVFSLNGVVDNYTGSTNFSVELSQPVEDYGTAAFNLSDAAQTLIRSVQSGLDMNSGFALASYGLIASVYFRTVWIYDNQEFETAEEEAQLIHIIPGGLTDYEMIAKDDIYLPSLAGSGIAMTRKPDGGILYKGETMIVPVVLAGENASKTTEVYLSVDGVLIYSGSSYIEENKLEYTSATTTSGKSDGTFEYRCVMSRTLSGYYRTNTNGVHFLRFINGFGAVENISVRARDKLTYEVSGETHSLVQEISTRPTDRRYATKSQPVGVYELSSGYVPQRWAEWYVQELLTSPRVWILLGGKWVPALIEAEDDCVIYDRTKPEMPHVDFTLRLAIDGVTGCVW